MQTYKEIIIENTNPQKTEVLLALLQNIGYYGFEEEEHHLKAFILAEDFDAAALQEIAQQQDFIFNTHEQQEQNWNALWESNFPVVVVDEFVTVKAPFHHDVVTTRHEIEIMPKMSFGTGHHATTYMMLQAMAQLDFTGKKVLDFGTGTGVLAILAKKLGAAEVHAIDNDEWSIENAKENIARNHCTKISISKRDDAIMQQQYDLILANINKNVLLQNMQVLSDQLSAQGSLLMSGLLAEDEADIRAAAKVCGLSVMATTGRLQWIMLQLTRQPADN